MPDAPGPRDCLELLAVAGASKVATTEAVAGMMGPMVAYRGSEEVPTRRANAIMDSSSSGSKGTTTAAVADEEEDLEPREFRYYRLNACACLSLLKIYNFCNLKID